MTENRKTLQKRSRSSQHNLSSDQGSQKAFETMIREKTFRDTALAANQQLFWKNHKHSSHIRKVDM